MSLENIPGFPGAGTVKLPADEAHAFTVHEFAKPRLAEVETAIARNGEHYTPQTAEWMEKERRELRALVDAPDRNMTADDLVWAATARCRCGAGFCYVKFLHDMHGSWLCSAIVLGTASADSEHDRAKPFTFWSIKSADQPSANGATTRPA